MLNRTFCEGSHVYFSENASFYLFPFYLFSILCLYCYYSSHFLSVFFFLPFFLIFSLVFTPPPPGDVFHSLYTWIYSSQHTKIKNLDLSFSKYCTAALQLLETSTETNLDLTVKSDSPTNSSFLHFILLQ